MSTVKAYPTLTQLGQVVLFPAHSNPLCYFQLAGQAKMPTSGQVWDGPAARGELAGAAASPQY